MSGADKVIMIHAGARILAGHTRNMVSIADWLSCRGYNVEFWEQDGDYVTHHPVFGRVVMRSSALFQLDEIGKYYDLRCMPRFVPKNYPTATFDGQEIVFPEDLADEMRAEGFITDMEVYSYLPEDLRMRGTLYINYPSVPIRKFGKLFANSRFTQFMTYKKWGLATQVFYPPVRNTFSPNQHKDIDFVIYSRLSPMKLAGLPEFLKVHGGRRIVVMGMDQGVDLTHYNVTVIKNATRAQVKAVLERAKNYVHFYTFRDGDQTYGEHFGQSIVEALYAGAQPWVPNVPSGALEIPGVLTYDTYADIRLTSGVDDPYIWEAMRMFDPDHRGDQVEGLLPPAKSLRPPAE